MVASNFEVVEKKNKAARSILDPSSTLSKRSKAL